MSILFLRKLPVRVIRYDSSGVITVYLSVTFLVMLSLVMVLLESARVYMIGTMTERYADMAGEMLFSSYVKPLAERYDLLVLDMGEEEKLLKHYENYLKLNLEKNPDTESRLFDMYGLVRDVAAESTESVRDNNWQSLKKQIQQYEKYTLEEKGVNEIGSLLTQFTDTGIDNKIKDYSEELRSEGQTADVIDEEKADEEKEAPEEVTDPRPGISRWLKSGLLNLVMGDKAVSNRTINTGGCSWHTGTSKKPAMLNSFGEYGQVAEKLEKQTITSQLSQGVKEQGVQMLVNLYILEKFGSLQNAAENQSEDGTTVLTYEAEYILSGYQTDRENLESAFMKIFTLRTLLNLAYLYTSPEKGEALQGLVQSLSLLASVPAAGQVLSLLLMACWAAAESVVDCAALADGKKVELWKKESSWNLTVEQLAAIGKNGGKQQPMSGMAVKGWTMVNIYYYCCYSHRRRKK